MATLDSHSMYDSVQSHYSSAANTIQHPVDDTTNVYGATVAAAFGYTPEDLLQTPTDANLGLSCGNPLVVAGLRAGETVVDLGCGAGFDVFAAWRKVGQAGKVIGIDMNEDMLARARTIAHNHHPSAANISFIHARLTAIPLPTETADCLISNCVINLVPAVEKPTAFREMFRLLKPGGRVAISDILLKDAKVLPDDLKRDVGLYVGCVAGASRKAEYAQWLKAAGFEDILITADNTDLNVYKTAGDSNTNTSVIGCCGPASKSEKPSCCGGGGGSSSSNGEMSGTQTTKARDIDLNEWAGSYKVYAVKPRA